MHARPPDTRPVLREEDSNRVPPSPVLIAEGPVR